MKTWQSRCWHLPLSNVSWHLAIKKLLLSDHWTLWASNNVIQILRIVSYQMLIYNVSILIRLAAIQILESIIKLCIRYRGWSLKFLLAIQIGIDYSIDSWWARVIWWARFKLLHILYVIVFDHPKFLLIVSCCMFNIANLFRRRVDVGGILWHLLLMK